MSSCLSGGRTYGLDLEIIKSPSPTTPSTQTSSSSPSSTLSESSNSRFAICTRKPRTARKRPNQNYNEAAALLSTAYPTIFSTNHLLQKPHKFTKHPHHSFFDQSSDLLLPFPVADSPNFLLLHHHHQIQEQPTPRIDPKPSLSEDDFDTESILDEEIEEGIIDSIMGISTDAAEDGGGPVGSWYGNPMGLGFGGKFNLGFGIRRGVRPLRHPDDGSRRFSPTVDVLEISPKLSSAVDKKKKRPSEPPKDAAAQPLLLKLNYEDVVKAWSDRGSPLPEIDVSARLAQIDLFTDAGGLREASVMRYKEKRRTRLFSNKIRYQVRKVNADRRPRMKGRFVRRLHSCQRG